VNGQLKCPIAKNKNKIKFGMHSQLINLDLQEGMVIKAI
jgi:hypothetical protein